MVKILILLILGGLFVAFTGGIAIGQSDPERGYLLLTAGVCIAMTGAILGATRR